MKLGSIQIEHHGDWGLTVFGFLIILHALIPIAIAVIFGVSVKIKLEES